MSVSVLYSFSLISLVNSWAEMSGIEPCEYFNCGGGFRYAQMVLKSRAICVDATFTDAHVQADAMMTWSHWQHN